MYRLPFHLLLISVTLLLEACGAYRRGEVTLSRAAEMADLSIREMILKLRDQDVTLSYGPDELATDLQSP